MDRATWNKNPWSTRQLFYKERLQIKRLLKPESLYLYDINRRKELVINLVPDDVAETYSPRIVSVAPFGVIRPINFYTGGEAKKVNFAVMIHEDYINEPIYDFLERLRRMSMPVTDKNVLKGPMVYFQLGEQFAGRGHITSSFDLQKPFRNGRYIVANLSLDFTFHEVFENDFTVTLNELDEIIKSDSIYAHTPTLIEDFSSYDNFLRITYSPEYFISQVYSTSKISRFLNTIEQSIWTNENELNFMSGTANPNLVEEELRAIRSGEDIVNVVHEAGGEYIGFIDLPEGTTAIQYYQNIYGIRLLSLLVQLRNIVSPVFTLRTIQNNLLTLQERLLELSEDLKNSFLPINLRAKYREEFNYSFGQVRRAGWYTYFFGSDSDSIYRNMPREEYWALAEAIEFTITIVATLISTYSSAKGAGD